VREAEERGRWELGGKKGIKKRYRYLGEVGGPR